ncbi:TonB-dependent receptor [Pontibacter oryzae]|uniref:TonB-dependent receptor n=1 Tax=Pontibacter oryzae TaxID=2304593 RepID=A0A399SJ03_9BACT|nr:carboxypeptidase regulatory-like domain-containing protein [Pontibacter oryzae]RIJ42974.1 TonB-dependent receptor [Pontibacter oryzae]
MKKFYQKLSIMFALVLLVQYSWAQGVTTSSMTGIVTDLKGEGLPGATVVAVHTPSGSQYGTTTGADGRFTIVNMRVGGPYKVTARYLGFQEQVANNIDLKLGLSTSVPFKLSEQSNALSEVQVVSDRNSPMSSEKTGAATNVSREVVQSIPTVSRGLKDFTKISPLANTSGNGTQFAGTNNRYNQFAIDGLINNDVFGLAGSGTNGGQTGIEPVSLDAIEEFQINIAPYDVRQGGFTGGGINAVTRSGTNNYQGSIYYYGNNEKLVGGRSPITGEKAKYPEYNDSQYGFRIGGPILKNKLFFFLNGEMTRSITPLAFDPTDPNSGSKLTMDEINRVISTVKRVAPNYDLGSYGEINDELNSNKLLAKIDWNINNNHKLTLRHSYAYGENIDNSRNNNSLRFYNNGQFFPSTTNSTGLELNSTFNNKYANNLLLGYTRVRDDRDPLGDPFPYVRIQNLTGSSSIQLGSENSSVANQLDQDVFSLTDNFSIFAGKHTFTFGTHNEFYSFYNLFVQNIYGQYVYNSLADFEKIGTAEETAPVYYQVGYSFENDGPLQSKGASDFSAMQLGLYAQDDIQLTNDLKVTFGIRADLPLLNDKAAYNDQFFKTYGSRGLSTDQLPETKVLWSPRVGFNWDVLGDNTLKVRGGTGIFTGRVPFVWVSNQYTNNGTLNGTYSVGSTSSSAKPITNPAGIKFVADPYAQPTAATYNGKDGRGDINITSEDFQYPQVFRSNIGVDKQLPWGLVASFEAIFSKGLNNVTFKNLNREVDSNFTFDATDKRPRYKTGRTDSNFNEIILLENSNKGYSYNLVAQLQKNFENGFTGSVAYTYGQSKDLNSGTSSTAYSNWRFLNNVTGPNENVESYANFDLRHRVTGFVSYRKEYFNHFATQVSLFYNGQAGQALSYIYDGDLNNDGTTNDLIFVPATRADINLVDVKDSKGVVTMTADDQWTALNAFIEGDEYLNERRGQYAQRNGARLPFQHQFDLKVLQDLGLQIGNSKNKLQLSFDVMNVGNLINKDWGKSYFVSNQGFNLIRYAGIQSGTTNKPTFQYTAAGQTDGKVYSTSDYSSRWRGQIGIRYIFN